MFVIVTYDAGDRRNTKVLRICRKYLTHVQKSVFEGEITKSKLAQLEKEIKAVLNDKDDSCQIYLLESTRFCKKLCFGLTASSSENILYR